MSLHVNTLALFFSSALAKEPEIRVATKTLKVYAHSHTKALKGMIPSRRSFWVYEHLGGDARCPAGWGVVHDDGVICLNNTRVSDILPTEEEEMLAFIPPDPEEYGYDFSSPPEIDLDLDDTPFLPHIHGRILPEKRGRLWASAEAYGAGERPRWRLKENRDYRFVDVIETERGLVLQRPNGRVTPIEEWFVYPVSQFTGRDVGVEPIPDGEYAAWPARCR